MREAFNTAISLYGLVIRSWC